MAGHATQQEEQAPEANIWNQAQLASAIAAGDSQNLLAAMREEKARLDSDAFLALLQHWDIPVVTHTHQPLFTVEDRAIAKATGQIIEMQGADTKTLFMRDKAQRYYMLVAAAEGSVDLKEFAKVNGLPRLSFASPRRLNEVLGVIPGSVTPFSLIHDHEAKVRVFIDQRLIDAGRAHFHPLINTRSCEIDISDLDRFLSYLKRSWQAVTLPLKS